MERLPYMFIRGTNHIYLVCSYDINGKFKQQFYDFKICEIAGKKRLKVEFLFDIDLEPFSEYRISPDDKYILFSRDQSYFYLFDFENNALLEQFDDPRIKTIEYFGFAFKADIVYFLKTYVDLPDDHP